MQQSAYEVRISDWSSAVCSSDLRTNGFILTAEGQRLLGYAESIESTLHMACEQVSGSGVALSGHVRMGCTEGFGSFFITPQLSHFVDVYPAISVDILRSEEHTSELQSLMRTSYAVFCFQKK